MGANCTVGLLIVGLKSLLTKFYDLQTAQGYKKILLNAG